MNSDTASKSRIAWVSLMLVAVWLLAAGALVQDGIAVAWAADLSLPVGTVPLGTVNAEMGEYGRQAAEEEAASLAKQRFRDFRNFFLIWLLVMLVGFLVWRFRPRQKWEDASATAKPEMEIEVEEEVVLRTEPTASVQSKPVVVSSASEPADLRTLMTTRALEWEERYGVSPLNLSVLAARDAALLLGMSDERYALHMQDRVFPISNDVDFVYNKKRYIVRSVRQNAAADARYVPKAHSSGWDLLVFILYDEKYAILGAWRISNEEYRIQCAQKEHLVSEDYKVGMSLV